MIDINQKLILKSHWNKAAKRFEGRDTRKMYFHPSNMYNLHIIYAYIFHAILQQFNLFAYIIFPSMALHFYQSLHILNICNKSNNVKREKSSRKSINDDDDDIDDGDGGGSGGDGVVLVIKTRQCIAYIHYT